MMFGLLIAKCVIFIENLEANKYIIQSLVEGYNFEVFPVMSSQNSFNQRDGIMSSPQFWFADGPWDTT